MTNLKILYQRPQALRPHPKNAREHSSKQLDLIAASIREFGFNVPVLVDGEGYILAGHGRVLVAIQLRLREVPTVSIEHLTDAQRRAFMIADNRLGELSTWNEPMLAMELEELTDLDEPLEITATGFELAKIDAVIEELHTPSAPQDPADLPVNLASVDKVTRLGDLWQLGRHRLFVGNALERESYQALLERSKAQLVFCDVPFNVPVAGHVSGLGKNKHQEFVMASGEMSDAEFIAFLRTAFLRLIESSVDGSIHFICMDWRGLKALLLAAEVYSELKNICCWVKSQGGMGSLYRSQHEFVAVLKAGNGHSHQQYPARKAWPLAH